jgi:hypothetical protein
MPAEAQQADPSNSEEDLAQAVLDAYDGDALAALRDVIADAAFLHDQLHTASCLLSRGIARGWQPRFQRERQP